MTRLTRLRGTALAQPAPKQFEKLGTFLEVSCVGLRNLILVSLSHAIERRVAWKFVMKISCQNGNICVKLKWNWVEPVSSVEGTCVAPGPMIWMTGKKSRLRSGKRARSHSRALHCAMSVSCAH